MSLMLLSGFLDLPYSSSSLAVFKLKSRRSKYGNNFHVWSWPRSTIWLWCLQYWNGMMCMEEPCGTQPWWFRTPAPSLAKAGRITSQGLETSMRWVVALLPAWFCPGAIFNAFQWKRESSSRTFCRPSEHMLYPRVSSFSNSSKLFHHAFLSHTHIHATARPPLNTLANVFLQPHSI